MPTPKSQHQPRIHNQNVLKRKSIWCKTTHSRMFWSISKANPYSCKTD